jgi:hypothetical protein
VFISCSILVNSLPAQHFCKPNQAGSDFLLAYNAGLVCQHAGKTLHEMLLLDFNVIIVF